MRGKKVLCPNCLNRDVPETIEFNLFNKQHTAEVCRKCKKRLHTPIDIPLVFEPKY